jgi:hypothetical protein
VWLEVHEGNFFHVPLAPIAEYQHWTREKFLDELTKLTDKYRNT